MARWSPTQIPSLLDCIAHVLNWTRLPALNAMLCIFLKLLINSRSKSGTELELGLFSNFGKVSWVPQRLLSPQVSPLPKAWLTKERIQESDRVPISLSILPYVTPSSHPSSLFSTLVIVVQLLSCV